MDLPDLLTLISQTTRHRVLKRVLSLIDEVLGLEDGHMWRLHEDDQGQTGDDVKLRLSFP